IRRAERKRVENIEHAFFLDKSANVAEQKSIEIPVAFFRQIAAASLAVERAKQIGVGGVGNGFGRAFKTFGAEYSDRFIAAPDAVIGVLQNERAQLFER